MSMRILFLTLLSALYLWFAHWFYTQKIPGICSGDHSGLVSDATGISDEDDILSDANLGGTTDSENIDGSNVGSITFNWSDAIPKFSDDFDGYRSSIVNDLDDDNMLEITGYYFEGEEIPEGFEAGDLGLIRAGQLRDILKTEIPEDRIVINSKLIDDIEDMELNPFEAADFKWIPRNRLGETTVVEVDDRILIFFPFESANNHTDTELEAKLSALADHLDSSGDRALIVGHTDSTGPADKNYRLGLDRAWNIRKILLRLGVDKTKLKMESKGETQPIGSNRTREGEQQNRRVVIHLISEK